MFFSWSVLTRQIMAFKQYYPRTGQRQTQVNRQVQAESLTSLPVSSFEDTQGPALICAKGRGQCGQLPCTVCEFFNPFGIHKHYPKKLQRRMGKKFSLHKKTVV